MIQNPDTIARALELMFISKSLERIADHATNIAEEMIYLAKGKDVRHTDVRSPAPAAPEVAPPDESAAPGAASRPLP